MTTAARFRQTFWSLGLLRRVRTAPRSLRVSTIADLVVVITIAKRVETELGHDSACVILDLRRLTELDSTGAGTLLEIKSDLGRRKIGLLLAVGTGSTAMERLGEFGALTSFDRADIFPDVDRAIERAEDNLLRTRSHDSSAELAASDVGLFAGYPQADIKAIAAQMKRKAYAAGTIVFYEGEPSDETLIVLKGTASAYLERANAASIRLATFSPGTVFGELALLDHGPRSASVVADGDLVCYALGRADYAELAEKSPSAAILFMAAIGRELSGRLRIANRTIHQLEV